MAPGEGGDGTVVLEALDSGDTEYGVLHYIASAMFSMLNTFLEISLVYMLRAKRLGELLEVKKCRLGTKTLLVVFCEGPLRVLEGDISEMSHNTGDAD